LSKILLVDPGKVSESWYDKRQCPHIGLAYIATHLMDAGHEVQVMDMAAYESSIPNYIDYLKFFTPDIIGVTAASFNILDAYDIIAQTKLVDPGVLTVLGGAHSSSIPITTKMECPKADIIVHGPGESIMIEMARMPTKYLGANIVKYGRGVSNIDDLSWPDWSLYDYDYYMPAYSSVLDKKVHIYPISTSRGCPFSCKFCFPLHGHKIKYRSISNVIAEIKYLKKVHEAELLYIVDSIFPINKERTLELCSQIGKLGILFKCQSRVELVDEEILSALKFAGCELIFYGIESGDDRILKANKGSDRKAITRAISLTKEAGIEARGSFIIGLNGDTRASIRRTIKFATELKSIGLTQAQFHCLDIYPGTGYWKLANRGNSIQRTYHETDWSVFSRNVATVAVGNLSPRELDNLRKDAMKAFEEA